MHLKLSKLILITVLFSNISIFANPTTTTSGEKAKGATIYNFLPIGKFPGKTEVAQTAHYKVVISSKGAIIQEFFNLDNENKLRDHKNIADPYPFFFEFYAFTMPSDFDATLKRYQQRITALALKDEKNEKAYAEIRQALGEILENPRGFFDKLFSNRVRRDEDGKLLKKNSVMNSVKALAGVSLKNADALNKLFDDMVSYRVKTDKVFNKNLAIFVQSEFKLTKTETDDAIQILAELPMIASTKIGNRPVTLRKRYTFYKKSSFYNFSIDLISTSKESLSLVESYFTPPQLIGPHYEKGGSRDDSAFFHFYKNSADFEKLDTFKGAGSGCGSSDLKNITIPYYKQKEDGTTVKNIEFFGESSRFMSTIITPLNNIGYLKFEEGTLEPKLAIAYKKNARQKSYIGFPAFQVSAEPSAQSFIVYSGPKLKQRIAISDEQKTMYSGLAKVSEELVEAFDFGITAPIRDLIVSILELLYKVIANYGVGIILFALLFKLVFWPLNQKQAESMKKMQALQPKMKEINERYADNPQEKQKRIMAMYKENKVNPVSGCLPMLIQLPIFIALYTAFSDSYELWQSPFITGWINDLSRPDTIANFVLFGYSLNVNILPLVMVASQFYQQMLTPTSGDANQQKIMKFMPLMMLFFFYTMPSGVVLYWTMQNILSIAQQLYTNMKGEENKPAVA